MGYYSIILLFGGIIIIGTLYSRITLKTARINLLFLFLSALYLTLFFLIHHSIEGTCEILIDGSVLQVIAIIESWGIAAPVISILLMILQAIIAPIPAFLITAANGLFFGIFWGTVISLLGALGGAMVSFSISRWLYISYAEKLVSGTKIQNFIEKMSGRYGFRIILIARLLPVVSFDLVSYAAGLSSIRAGSFLTATLIGMTPATIIYTAFGNSVILMEKYSNALFVYSIAVSAALLAAWALHSIIKKRSSE